MSAVFTRRTERELSGGRFTLKRGRAAVCRSVAIAGNTAERRDIHALAARLADAEALKIKRELEREERTERNAAGSDLHSLPTCEVGLPGRLGDAC